MDVALYGLLKRTDVCRWHDALQVNGGLPPPACRYSGQHRRGRVTLSDGSTAMVSIPSSYPQPEASLGILSIVLGSLSPRMSHTLMNSCWG